MTEQIPEKLELLLTEHFGINMPKDKNENLYLLGMMPRDMLKLVVMIESEFGLQFSEQELLENKFDSFEKLVKLISNHVN